MSSQPPLYAGLDAVRPDNATLVVVGDTQRTSRLELWWRSNDAEQSALLAEVARRTPAAVLNVGDLVTWGTSAAHWRRFDRAHAPIRAAGVPVLPVLGNHDYLPWPPRGLAPYRARFPVLAEARWFLLRHRGVAFVALDSNLARLGRHLRAVQRAWLAETCATLAADPEVRGVVGLWHHPPLTNSRVVRPAPRAARELGDPIRATGKAVAIFTGHCHAYEHFLVNGLHHVVTGGGGGPLQPLWTDPRRRRYPDLFSWPGRHRFLHFCALHIGDSAIETEIIRLVERSAPEVVDRFAIPLR